MFCLGDFINHGYANLYITVMIFTGAGTQSFGGSGTYQGNGSRPVIGTLQRQGTGTVTVGFPCNVRLLNPLAGTIAGGGNIEIDFTRSQVFGEPTFNGRVSQAVVTAMGSGYTQAPVVGPSGASLWTAASSVPWGSIRHANGQIYVCTTAGTTGSTAPSHTSGTASDNLVTWLWVGTAGTVGNPFTSASNGISKQPT